MRIYWTMKSVPELAPLSKEQRKSVWHATRWKAFRHWQFWVASAAFIVWFLIIFAFLDLILIRDGTVVRIGRFFFGGIAVGIGALILNHMAIELKRPYMRRLLQSQGSRANVDA